MSRSLFVSYVYEDKKYFEDARRWAEEKLLGKDVVVTGEAADVRQGGDAEIEQHLKPRIQGASAVLCLVGRDTHNHEWVRRELAWATSAGKQVVAARVPGTTGAAPEGFRHLPLVALDPSAIRKALGT
jgi:hypothetical protein